MVLFKQLVEENCRLDYDSLSKLTVGLVGDEDGVLPLSRTKITKIFVVITRHKTSLLEPYAN